MLFGRVLRSYLTVVFYDESLTTKIRQSILVQVQHIVVVRTVRDVLSVVCMFLFLLSNLLFIYMASLHSINNSALHTSSRLRDFI